MARLTFRHLALGLIAAPLALGLAACGGKEDDSGKTPTGEPIEAIAPPDGESWTEVVSKTEEGGYRMGNPDAPIKLVEYGSLTCPHCAHFAEQSQDELLNDFVTSGRVSYEFRNFVMNPLDLTMAMIVRCGSPQSFFALVEQTYANQHAIVDTWSKAGEDTVTQAANQPADTRYLAIANVAGLGEFYAARGISTDQSMECLANGETAEALVQATSSQSEEFDITGTPSFLIDGQKVDINTWPEIKTRLENLGAR